MSEESQKVSTTAAGASGIPGVSGGGQAQEVDWRKKAEEAEQENQRIRVEQGRVKALAQRAKELEEELAKVKNAKAHSTLPENLQEAVSDETAQAASVIARNETGIVRQELLERDSKTRADIDQMRQEMIDYKIDSSFPGFRQAVDAGGNLADKWRKFLSVDGPSVAQAYGRNDMAALGVLIRRFYSEAGVPVQGGNPSAVAEPLLAAGGGEGGQAGAKGRIYSQAEFEAENARIKRDLARGVIDRPEYQRVDAELMAALNEGRVR